MTAVELLHIVPVKDGFAWLYRLKKWFYFVEEFFFDHARLAGGGIHVIFEDVPSGEDQIIESGEWNEVVDLGCAPFGPLAEPHCAHLCDRSDWFRVTFAHGFYAGDERGCHCSHTGNHDSQLAFGRSYFVSGSLLVFRHSWLIAPDRSKLVGKTSMFSYRELNCKPRDPKRQVNLHEPLTMPWRDRVLRARLLRYNLAHARQQSRRGHRQLQRIWFAHGCRPRQSWILCGRNNAAAGSSNAAR